jgi:hypothetical protein
VQVRAPLSEQLEVVRLRFVRREHEQNRVEVSLGCLMQLEGRDCMSLPLHIELEVIEEMPRALEPMRKALLRVLPPLLYGQLFRVRQPEPL